jgi:hypothetical protein
MNTRKTAAGLDESLQRDPFQVIEGHGRIVQKDNRRIILEGVIGKKQGRIGNTNVKSVLLSQFFYCLHPIAGIACGHILCINKHQWVPRPLVFAGYGTE